MPKYVIEHLEPRVWKWCAIEYDHISQIVGKKNLWITNAKSEALKKYGRAFRQSVTELGLKRACVLDPEAKKTLTPKEAKKFSFFVFGGILGNYPPKKRTKKELTRFLKHASARNLGRKQMSTDNAVFVVKQIVSGKRLSDIKFSDGIELELRKGESIVLPYRYALLNGKPLVSKALVEFLKRRRGF